MNWEEYSRASERDYSSKGKPSDMQEGLPPGLFLVLAPYSLPEDRSGTKKSLVSYSRNDFFSQVALSESEGYVGQ